MATAEGGATRAARRGRIAMIVHAYYEEDARVRREAEALIAAGWEVDVYALRRPDAAPSERLEGVNIRRLPVRRHQGAGLGVYVFEYGAFLLRAMWAAVRAQPRRHYRLVEVHTLPDYLVFAALPLKLAGVPVLLDLHEAMPEFFLGRFPKAANAFTYRLLRWQERLSIAAANEVLTVNEALADRLRGMGVPPEKITVVLNAPDLSLFDPAASRRRQFMADGTLRLVYAGALTPTYELDVALRAIAVLGRTRPDIAVEARFYGRGDAETALRALARELGVAGCVSFPGRIPIEQVPAAIAAADAGLAPTRLDRFTAMSLSTKLLEYAAMGKPVVASRLPTVERYFLPGTLSLYEPGDPDSLAASIAALVDDAAGREAQIAAAGARIEELGWARQAALYTAVVDRLTSPRPGRDGARARLQDRMR